MSTIGASVIDRGTTPLPYGAGIADTTCECGLLLIAGWPYSGWRHMYGCVMCVNTAGEPLDLECGHVYSQQRTCHTPVPQPCEHYRCTGEHQFGHRCASGWVFCCGCCEREQ